MRPVQLLPLAACSLAVSAVHASHSLGSLTHDHNQIEHQRREQTVDPNDDDKSDDWYLDTLKLEDDGPGANATSSASFTSYNLTRSNLDDDPDIDWDIELLVFSNITVEDGGDSPGKRENQVGSVLRYMPEVDEVISDDHFVCAAGFTVDAKDHHLGDEDELDDDCGNALEDGCLDWLRRPGISLCSPSSTPPSSCHAGNRFAHMVRNGTADTRDPPSLWLNQNFGDDDSNPLSGDEAYDHVIRQVYVATWGVYSNTRNEAGDRMPGGDQKEYFLRCLRADDIPEGSRTMEDGAPIAAPKLALLLGVVLAVALL